MSVTDQKEEKAEGSSAQGRVPAELTSAQTPPAPTRATVWRNVGLFLASDSLASVSWSVASGQTVVAVLLQKLGFAKVVIGLPSAVGTLGFSLPQVPAAFWALRAKQKKSWLVGLRAVGSLPALVAAMGAMVAAPRHPWATALLLFVPLLLGSIASGGSRPVRSEMDARLIPQSTRGRYYGATMLAQGAFGMLGAALAGLLLREIPARGGFAACFVAATVLGVVSAAPLRYLLELETRGNDEHRSLWDYLGSLRRAVGGDVNFRNFLWGRVLVGLGYMSAGFFAVFALDKFDLPAATAPLFMIPGLLGQSMGSIIWGWVGDKKGHQILQVAVCVQAALAGVFALVAPNPWFFAVAFWLLGMSNASDFISTNNFMIESAPHDDKMGYVSYANTLIAPIFALATVMGGAIADLTSYPFLFALSTGIYVFGGWVMSARVRDPRLRASSEGPDR